MALLAGAVLAPVGVSAQEPGLPDGLRPGPVVRVSDVVDADTVRLTAPADGAMEVRLVGIQGPKLPLGRPDFKPWPLAEEARAALSALVEGRDLTLRFGGAERDRHGRLLAHLVRDDGLWIQGAMLQAGFARVYTFADNRQESAPMLALEKAARARRAGIWSQSFYAVRRATAPAQLAGELGTFQLIDGQVRNAAQVRGRVYLNYGTHWRSDFTVIVEAKALRLFRDAGIDLLGLKDTHIRVRGWLYENGGPAIELTHPEALEIITAQ
jgi:micrococcal nuclease